MSKKEEEKKKSETREIIDKILDVMSEIVNKTKRDELGKAYGIMGDLRVLFDKYSEEDVKECGKLVIQRYIKLLNVLIAVDVSKRRRLEYCVQLENAYKLAARVSLEHFIIYYEWEEEDKLLEKRYPILQAYVYYLNKMCYDENFEGMIVNLPSGYGKSRVCRYYEAFRLGLNPEGTFLALCSNDDLIKGQSRSVIDIMKNPRYGDVFPKLRYDKKDKDYFLKETDGEWKLRDCKLISSYYAKTVKSNVVGIRASLSIDIDDLYASWQEALDENLNKRYYNDFVTVWRKRYVQNKKAQVLITGTLWSPTDFLTKVMMLWENESKFKPHPTLKYTRISEDGNKVIIQVPAIDPETQESTCPDLRSTEELLKEKASMSTYLWETNFQQNPISPEGLYFDWSNLSTYEKKPVLDGAKCYAALDPNRKGNDYIAMPVFVQIDGLHYLVDCYFTQKSIRVTYDNICTLIIKRHITLLVVETNTETSIADIIYKKLAERGYHEIKIIERYNTENKEVRINKYKDVILRNIVFPSKVMYGLGTMLGSALEQMTTYSFEYPNRHDDMIDAVAMYADQIIEGNGFEMKAEAIMRPF